MLRLIKDLLVPGSAPFLILGLIPGVILMYRRGKAGRVGQLWVTLLTACYLALSLPVAAIWLIETISPAYPPLETRDQAHGATAIVVVTSGVAEYRSRGQALDALTGESALRMLEAVRVYRLLDRPWVVVSGGAIDDRQPEALVAGDALEQRGVPRDRIVLELQAMNTHDHALRVPPLLRERGVRQFVLVTSRQHIRRALAVFRAVGLSPIPSMPEPLDELRRRTRLERYLPSQAALSASQTLIYDELGMVYYWLRGWL